MKSSEKKLNLFEQVYTPQIFNLINSTNVCKAHNDKPREQTNEP